MKLCGRNLMMKCGIQITEPSMAERSHTVLFYGIKQKVREIFAYFGGRSMKLVNFKDCQV